MNISNSAIRKIMNLSQLSKLFYGAIYLLCGYIIAYAHFPLSVHPTGVALISCAPLSCTRLRGYSTFSFFMLCLGAVASTLTYAENGILYFTMYCALFLIRMALTDGKFNEGRTVKMALSLTSSLCIGCVAAAINGFGIWQILSILVLSVCSPVFSFLMDGISDEETSPILLQASIGAILFSLLYGIRTLRIFAFSIPIIISVMLTLAAARKKGALYGALVGLVCGIAGENFILPPVLGIMGFASGLFFEYSDIFALLIAYIGGIGYGIYCTGLDAVGYLAPEFLIGCAAFFPLKGLVQPAYELPATNEESYYEKECDGSDHLVKMSEAFSALSGITGEAQDSELPDKAECAYFVGCAFRDTCKSCTRDSVCTLRDDIIMESLQKRLCEMLYRDKGFSELPESFTSQCRHHRDITKSCTERYNNAVSAQKPSEKSKVLSGEYNTVSKLFRSTAQKYSEKPQLADSFKVKRVLDELKISHRSFDIKGGRKTVIDVVGICSTDIAVSSSEIQEKVQKICGFSIDVPEIFMRDGCEVMRMVRCPMISLEYAKSSCTKSGEQKNGDSISVFENDDGCFYSLICDGMGSGRDAARASRIATAFIQKLIASSSPEDITIEMLNNYLISKEDECFSTIDLLEIDRMESKASFIKAGAAPAFVIRNGKLHKISSNTPPVGVLYSMTAQKTTLALEKNDIIVMLSDGIMENGDIAPWLMELFTYELEGTPDTMASKIITSACERCGRRDDMSVAVMRIA